jgi:hypothetical protein
MAQNQNVNIKATVTVDDSSVKQYNNTLDQTQQKTQEAFNPKKALREATQELIAAQQQFGLYSKEATAAARKVADLRDQIKDAREASDRFDPGKKFGAYSKALQSTASAFAGVQGAIGLLGVESDKVNEQLLKVQSALALSEGLSTIGDIKKDFTDLADTIKTQAVGAFNSLKAAIGSTGIGLLVIALGALVAYWDDIKAAVSGVNEEQKKGLADAKQAADLEEKKLDDLDLQDNVLKLQGKTEKEITKSKVDQLQKVIDLRKAELEKNRDIIKGTIEAEKRNNKFLQNVLRVAVEASLVPLRILAAPIDILLKTVNSVSEALGFTKVTAINLNDEISKLAQAGTKKVADFVFDAKKTEAEGAATIAAAERNIKVLESKKAGYQLSSQEIDKKGSSASAENAKKSAEAELAAQADLEKKKQERELAAIKDEDERRKKQIENELAAEKDRINKLENVKAETKAALIAEAEAKAQSEKDKIDEAKREKEKKNEEDFQKQLNAIKEENDLKAIKDEDERAIQAIKNSYQKQLAEIDANEKFNAEQKALLKAELLEKEDAELSAKQDEIDKKNIEKLKAFEEEKRKIEADTLAATKELQDKRNDLLKAGLNVLSSIAGDNEKIANVIFAIQKAIEIGRIISSTSAAIAQVQAGVAAVPAILPPGIPNPAFAAATAIGIKKTLGLKLSAAAQIAEIAAASISKFKGGGGTAPSGGGAQAISGGGSVAPLQPQIPQAIQNQQLQTSVNQLATQTSRAYVVESDVSNSQERIRRINRAATFG